MTDPVICADGQTYERHAIEAWFALGMMTSPSTGAALPHRTLTQNIVLRNCIEEWQEIHGMHLRRADIVMEAIPCAAGSFKNVYRGSLRITKLGGDSKRVEVAVLKMRRGDCAMEARMLLRIGRHPRVVRFVGQCVDGEDQLLITEFAPLGSLTDAFATMGDKITLAHSVVIMQQIAQAMEHLVSEKILHRDLAARNVLLFAFDENNVRKTSVKLSDYGLAVGIYNRSHVSFASGDKPVRYMPPEALQKAWFSEKSDVWAFGVTCWEILTLGDVPYFKILEERIIAHVCDGGRLQLVGDSQLVGECPEALWGLINSCWCTVAKDRPTFAEVVAALGSMSAQIALPRAEALLAEERLNREKQKALQEAGDARVARALQVEEEERIKLEEAKAAAEKTAAENAAAGKAAAEAKASMSEHSKSTSRPLVFKNSWSVFGNQERDVVKYCTGCGQGTAKDDRTTCKTCGLSSWISRRNKEEIESLHRKLLRYQV